MKIIHAFFMCFGMFTAIPCPYRPWDEKARPQMIACLPAVGAVVGALWSLLALVLRALGAPGAVAAACLTLCPFVLTGMIHLDGFMDTCDAVLSRRPLEERRRILKDPHAGAFGIAMMAFLLVVQFSLFLSMPKDFPLWALTVIPVASRACAAVGVSALRPLPHSEYAGDFHADRRTIAAALVQLALCAGLALFFLSLTGVIVMAAAVLGYALCAQSTYRSLEGFSGDLSGHAQTIAELCALCALLACSEVL